MPDSYEFLKAQHDRIEAEQRTKANTGLRKLTEMTLCDWRDHKPKSYPTDRRQSTCSGGD